LVKQLQKDESFDRVRLARIEWGFLPFLDREISEIGPDTLLGAINAEPSFFVELLRAVYRGKSEKPSEKSVTEQEQFRAFNARHLLDGLNKLPGSHPDGTLDVDYLRDWIGQVRAISATCDRREICDLTLGQLIGRASRKSDETWPSPEVAKVMQEVGSDALFEGFVNGVLNSRGAVTRDSSAGGEKEMLLVTQYQKLSEHARSFSPKLAKAFLDLAHHYEAYARHEDDEASRRRLGR
jgi:hypothetical protein